MNMTMILIIICITIFSWLVLFSQMLGLTQNKIVNRIDKHQIKNQIGHYSLLKTMYEQEIERITSLLQKEDENNEIKEYLNDLLKFKKEILNSITNEMKKNEQ